MGQAKAMETMDQIAAEVNRKEIITSNEPDVCVCVGDVQTNDAVGVACRVLFLPTYMLYIQRIR